MRAAKRCYSAQFTYKITAPQTNVIRGSAPYAEQRKLNDVPETHRCQRYNDRRSTTSLPQTTRDARARYPCGERTSMLCRRPGAQHARCLQDAQSNASAASAFAARRMSPCHYGDIRLRCEAATRRDSGGAMRVVASTCRRNDIAR